MNVVLFGLIHITLQSTVKVMEQQLITRREAAKLLGLTPQTLAKWAMTGKNLNVVRISTRSVRYRLADIERFVQEKTFQGSSTTDSVRAEGD